MYKGKWKRVEDELPKLGEEVWAYTGGGSREEAGVYDVSYRGECWLGDCLYLYDVTHWARKEKPFPPVMEGKCFYCGAMGAEYVVDGQFVCREHLGEVITVSRGLSWVQKIG